MKAADPLLALALVLLLSPSAWAEDQGPAGPTEHEEAFEAIFEGHLGLPLYVHGEAEAGPFDAELEGSPANTTLSAGVRAEVWIPAGVSMFADFWAFDWNDDRQLLTAGSNGELAISQEVDVRRLSLDLGFAFRAVVAELAEGVELELAPTLGAALVNYRSNVNLLVNGVARSVSETEDTLELTVGLDTGVFFADGLWGLVVRADLGGFGIGNASDLTWKMHLMARWRAFEQVGFEFGYRGLFVEYSRASGVERLEVEGGVHGLFLGIAVFI